MLLKSNLVLCSENVDICVDNVMMLKFLIWNIHWFQIISVVGQGCGHWEELWDCLSEIFGHHYLRLNVNFYHIAHLYYLYLSKLFFFFLILKYKHLHEQWNKRTVSDLPTCDHSYLLKHNFVGGWGGRSYTGIHVWLDIYFCKISLWSV